MFLKIMQRPKSHVIFALFLQTAFSGVEDEESVRFKELRTFSRAFTYFTVVLSGLILLIILANFLHFLSHKIRHIVSGSGSEYSLSEHGDMSISSLLYEVVLSDLEDSVCVICIEEFENHTMAAKLSCGHVFHEMCIAKWLIKNRKCPICYQDFKYGIDLKTDYQYKKNETRVDDYETKSNCSEDTFEVKKKWGRRSKRYCEMMQRTRRLFKGRFYTIGEGGESSFIVDRDENDKGYLSV